MLPGKNKRMTRDWKRQLMQVNDKGETERVCKSDLVVGEEVEKVKDGGNKQIKAEKEENVMQ